MAIFHVLRRSATHLSPGDVYKGAKKDFPSPTEPTVYRTLEFLAKNGLVRPTQAGNGHLRYELAEHEHHHLVCRICGGEVEVKHGLLESLYGKMESTSGYTGIYQMASCPPSLLWLAGYLLP